MTSTAVPAGEPRGAIRPGPARVSVVIPTWNGGARFRELLAILGRQTIPGGFELVVVDSGSGDGTAEAAEAAGARVHRIPQAEFNHGGTRNLGIGLASGELVALLTQDAVPRGEDYLERLLAPLADGGRAVDGVYARQFPRPDCDPILAERLRQWSASREEPTVSSLAPGDPGASRGAFEALEPFERYLRCAFDNVASALRRGAWERHPFPERNFGEDVAWAREVLLDGGAIAFEPRAEVEHSHRIDMGREFRRIYRDHKNLSALFGLRNVPSWGAVLRGWKHQRGFYRELLAAQGLPGLRSLYWRAYSVPYALLETAAQFLGARSHWKVEESRFWSWVDRRLCAD